MMDALLPPPSMRRLLPEQRRRAAPWIVGLMTFVSLVVGIAGAGALGAIGDLDRAAEGRWSLQVTGTPEEAARAEAMLRASAEVANVERVPEAEVRSTLRRWLGPGADTLGLPLPLLGQVTIRPGADGAALARRVATQVPSARLSPYSRELAPLLETLRGLAVLVIGLLLVLAAALAAAVTLAARATLEANRATLDVLHGIGATDRQLLSLVQRRIALDALVGSLAGAAAAGIVVVLALIPARGLLGGWAAGPSLPPLAWALLLLLPLLQAGLATLVARRALVKALADGP